MYQKDMDMNKKLIQKWVDWLRDPKNKQTKSVLCRIDENGDKCQCCLGGLAELYKIENGQKVEWKPKGYSRTSQFSNTMEIDLFGDTWDETLPEEVFTSLGTTKGFHPKQLPPEWIQKAMDWNTEHGYSQDKPISFEHLNDSLNLTFPQIANCIEHMYLKDGKEDSSKQTV